MIMLLKDISECEVDAVIITEKSTVVKVQKAIDKCKDEVDMYTWDDLLDYLPYDCKVIDRWGNLGVVTY